MAGVSLATSGSFAIQVLAVQAVLDLEFEVVRSGSNKELASNSSGSVALSGSSSPERFLRFLTSQKLSLCHGRQLVLDRRSKRA